MLAKGLEQPGLDEETEEPIIPEEPAELVVLSEFEATRMLPWAGGTRDQPRILMDILYTCMNARNEIERVQEIKLNANRSRDDLA